MDELLESLKTRFGTALAPPWDLTAMPAGWPELAGRGSCRRFAERPVSDALIELLAALALSAPTKSDLQQRDIILVRDPALRQVIDGLLADQPWTGKAPVLLVFCGNNRRQRLLHQWRGRPFANDHLDAFFNAAVDAGIALASFVTAAEAAGLGCCPISAIRNQAAEVSRLLGLPDWVFPVAGLALGWPAAAGEMNLRLPLEVTLHKDRYDETGLRDKVEAYDARREGRQPYASQRDEAEFGRAEPYGWSEDKARQYAKLERSDFGAFVRKKGFDLD